MIKIIICFIVGFSVTGSFGLGVLIFIFIDKLKTKKEYEAFKVDEWMPNFIKDLR